MSDISSVFIHPLFLLFFFGIWQPFDDGSLLRFSILQSNLSMLVNDVFSLIVGDFNADFNRGRRFDKEIDGFVIRYEFTKLTTKSGV